MNNLIPECLHLLGPAAAKWFTHDGLLAFQNVTWNPDSGRTQSNDREMAEFVDEDFYGMGANWKPVSTARPTASTPSSAPHNPAVKTTTAKEMSEQRQLDNLRGDASVKSFGARGGARDHDGDTVQTKAPELPDDAQAQLNGEDQGPAVHLDLTGMEVKDNGDKEEFDAQSMSTMGQTTGSTRMKLKSTSKHNDALIAENEKQALEMEQLEDEKDKLASMMQAMSKKLAALEASAKKPRKSVTLTPAASDSNSAHPSTGPGSTTNGASPTITQVVGDGDTD
jgi:hypothetical protein